MKKKIAIFIMAVMLLVSVFPFTVYADEAGEGYEITEFPETYDGYTPTPLLVLVVSFDPDGDGKDAYKSGLSTTVRGEGSYGEQWAYSSETYWSGILFGDSGKTMKNYFKTMSNDNFWFTPAKETYGQADNGIVYVTVNQMHPHALKGTHSNSYGGERLLALKEAEQYVDFASYDTNGDGFISYTELSLVYVIAGYNSKWGGSLGDKYAWGQNCYEVGSSGWSTNVGGVTLLDGSHGGSFVYVGEFMGVDVPIQFGTITHELGHVLGASDLYTYSGYTWCGGPGETALQGGGSSLKRPGELAGQSPSAIDPYYLEYFGFQKSTVVNDGEYILHSRESTQGEYNILRINTMNPNEYYLIENRFTAKTSSYDGIPDAAKAVMIWHVDETIMSSTNLPNCYKGTAHAPGLTPLYPDGGTGGSNYNAWDSSDGTFTASSYRFTASETPWLTLSTAEEASEAGFDLKITVAGKPGNDMAIKISGTIKQAPLVKASASVSTTDTVTVNGRISNLNAGTLTSLTVELSQKADFSSLIGKVSLKPEDDTTFKTTFTGLTPNTTYFTRVTTEGSNGKYERVFNAYTKAVQKERTEDYLVYLYPGLTSANRSYEIKVKIGKPITYGIPMKKTGYTFAGWYYDEEYTEMYDMSFTKMTFENMYLYARWVENKNAVTLTLSGATAVNPLFAIKTGENFIEPEIKTIEGKTFDGWFADAAFTVPFNFDEKIDEAGNITVYAKWLDGSPSSETTSVTNTETTSPSAAETTTTSVPKTTGTETTEEKTNSVSPVTVIVIIAAVLVAAIVVFLVIKKKK